MSDSSEDFVCTDRSVYLITYSKADTQKVETREQFSSIFIEAFGESVVQQWVCSREKHKEEGVHFHLALSYI